MSELRALPSNTQLLVTSRHVPSIEAGLIEPQRLEIRASDKDVRIYLDDRIEREDRLKRHVRADPALRDLVIDSIAEKAQGMYAERPKSGIRSLLYHHDNPTYHCPAVLIRSLGFFWLSCT